jgi:creatinine amidohydrolase
MKKILLFLSTVFSIVCFAQNRNPDNKAVYLEDISWTTAQQYLTPDAVIVMPLGAGSKEHGPHLPLSTDFIQAEGLAKIVALNRKVIITPVVNYGFYPAFLKYSGSTSTNFRTATDMVVQIVRSLAGYGPKRFYIINVGVSTTPTLETAAKILAEDGILLYYSRYDRPAFDKAEAQFRTKEYSGHADELETSNILHLRPDLVDMSKAVNDSSMKDKRGNMSPVVAEGGNLNSSGINGYAALGTKEKGKKNIASFANELIKEIDSVTNCTLPVAKDRTAEYLSLEGIYTDAAGKKLIISQKDNTLYFVWDGRDVRSFFHLYKDAPDYFSSMAMNILFVRNEKGSSANSAVEKAWCQYRGESFWVVKER